MCAPELHFYNYRFLIFKHVLSSVASGEGLGVGLFLLITYFDARKPNLQLFVMTFIFRLCHKPLLNVLPTCLITSLPQEG